MRIVDIVPEVGGDLDVLVIGLGAQPPVALLTVLLAQCIGIETEGLAHKPFPLVLGTRAEPMLRTNVIIADHARFASPIHYRQSAAEGMLLIFYAMFLGLADDFPPS